MDYTSWWPFNTGPSSSSSSPANFLHLSRLNIQKILDLIECCGEPLNPNQCRKLSSKLERTIQSIGSLVDSCSAHEIGPLCGSAALENFHRVSEKAKQLVEKCCSVNWCRGAAFQILNEEAFKEILLETGLSYNTIYALVEVNLNRNRNIVCLGADLRNTSTFEPPTTEEVHQDRILLYERLKGLVTGASSSVDIRCQYLGKYLLGRLTYVLQRSEVGDFDVRSYSLWPDGMGPDGEWSETSDFLGGNVCKTSWLDVPCAKKLFQDEMQEDEWSREAGILASLNHPNIVKFLCCNKYETRHSWGHFIAMEQMETSLGSFLKKLAKEGGILSLLSAVDIIIQIAYAMCYLHEHGVAHRDLKPSNVVCSIVAMHGRYELSVKVVDFGLSKVRLKASESNTVSRPRIGTTLYMSPEAFTSGRANWFKADVYSFSVMCSVILSGNEPFAGLRRSDICAAICRGERPNLPVDIPVELASLIMEGWATNRDVRPGFVDICTRLEKIRHRLLWHRSLGPSMLEQQNNFSDLYIEETLKRRLNARQQQRSQLCPQGLKDFCVEDQEWFECEAEAGYDVDKATEEGSTGHEANPQLIFEADDSDVHSQPKLISASSPPAKIYALDKSDVDGMNLNAWSLESTSSDVVPRTRYFLTIEINEIQVELLRRRFNVAQEGTNDLRPRSEIVPRMRRGFTKVSIEIRPPKFKKKLWFGTWTEEEKDRACDAINYYMGGKGPFILPDSPLIFAQHPLGIEYRDLKPSCEEFLQVGQNRVRASVHFARRVKEVIKAVTRGKSKKVSTTCKRGKLVPAHNPILPCAFDSMSRFSCASPSTYFTCSTYSSISPSDQDDMVWFDASSEVSSELAPEQPSGVHVSERLPSEGKSSVEPKLFSWCEEWLNSQQEIAFSSISSVAGSVEDDENDGAIGCSAFLWTEPERDQM